MAFSAAAASSQLPGTLPAPQDKRDVRRLAVGQRGAAVAADAEHPEPDVPGQIEPEVALFRGGRHRRIPLTPVAPGPAGGPVAKQRGAVHHHLDLAADTGGGPQQHTGGAEVGRRPAVVRAAVTDVGPAHHQQVMNDQPAGRCMPGRLEHHGARDVPAVMRHLGTGWTEPELPRGPVQQRPEHTRRVGPGQAQPLDRAVRRDQAALLAVGQEGIVRNERKSAHRPVTLRRQRSTTAVMGSADRSVS